MICRPARISRAMNGVVFQTSATTIPHRAGPSLPVHRIEVPKTLLTMPWKAKMKKNSLAVTAVEMAHGTRTAAHRPSLDAVRTRPPLLRSLAGLGCSPLADAPDCGSVDMPAPCHMGLIALGVWTRGSAAVGGPKPTHRCRSTSPD